MNVWLYIIIPKGFFPQQDTGRLVGGIQADQSISFQRMSKKLKQFIDIVQGDPDVATAVGTTGAGGGGWGAATNSGRLYVDLKPLSKRRLTSDRVINRLRPKLAKIAGATLFLFPPRRSASAAGRAIRSTSIRCRRTTCRISGPGPRDWSMRSRTSPP